MSALAEVLHCGVTKVYYSLKTRIHEGKRQFQWQQDDGTPMSEIFESCEEALRSKGVVGETKITNLEEDERTNS